MEISSNKLDECVSNLTFCLNESIDLLELIYFKNLTWLNETIREREVTDSDIYETMAEIRSKGSLPTIYAIRNQVEYNILNLNSKNKLALYGEKLQNTAEFLSKLIDQNEPRFDVITNYVYPSENDNYSFYTIYFYAYFCFGHARGIVNLIEQKRKFSYYDLQEPVEVKEKEPVEVKEKEPVEVKEKEPVEVKEKEPVEVKEKEPVEVKEKEPVEVKEKEPVEAEPKKIEPPKPTNITAFFFILYVLAKDTLKDTFEPFELRDSTEENERKLEIIAKWAMGKFGYECKLDTLKDYLSKSDKILDDVKNKKYYSNILEFITYHYPNRSPTILA